MALEFFKNSVAVVLKNKESASFYFYGFFNFPGQNFVTGANGRGILQDFQSQFRPEFCSQMLMASYILRKIYLNDTVQRNAVRRRFDNCSSIPRRHSLSPWETKKMAWHNKAKYFLKLHLNFGRAVISSPYITYSWLRNIHSFWNKRSPWNFWQINKRSPPSNKN